MRQPGRSCARSRRAKGFGAAVVNSFIAWYLFLAGAGAGAFLIGALVDIALRFSDSPRLASIGAVTDGGLVVGPAAVVLGTVFLLADLGSPERAFQVFLTPSTSLLTVGSWAIAVFCASSVFALLVGEMVETPVSRAIEAALHGTATVASACVILYSGVYLSMFPSVPFLHSPTVPVLFVASALSTGMALLLIFGFVVQGHDDVSEGLEECAKIDLALIAFEAVVLVVFAWLSVGAQGPVAASAEALLLGDRAGLFWLGVVIVGLVVPTVMGVLHLRGSESFTIAVGSGCALAGGLCLRYVLLLSAVRFDAIDMSAVAFWG